MEDPNSMDGLTMLQLNASILATSVFGSAISVASQEPKAPVQISHSESDQTLVAESRETQLKVMGGGAQWEQIDLGFGRQVKNQLELASGSGNLNLRLRAAFFHAQPGNIRKPIDPRRGQNRF